MHGSAPRGRDAYAAATVGRMVSRTRDTHTTNRVIRVPDDQWEAFGDLAGVRDRARVLREFIAWYVREPGAKRPERPAASQRHPDA